MEAAFPWSKGSFVVSLKHRCVLDSASAMAAVLKHAFPEERQKLTHITFGELKAVIASER